MAGVVLPPGSLVALVLNPREGATSAQLAAIRNCVQEKGNGGCPEWGFFKHLSGSDFHFFPFDRRPVSPSYRFPFHEEEVGKPSKWTTLRALIVLNRYYGLTPV